LLGSDASKLAWLAETDSVELLAQRFIPAVTRLAEMYQELSERLAEWPGELSPQWRPAAFAVQATLWRAKIGVLLGEEDIADSLLEVHLELGGGAIA